MQCSHYMYWTDISPLYGAGCHGSAGNNSCWHACTCIATVAMFLYDDYRVHVISQGYSDWH